MHDRWIISRHNTVTAEVNRHMENFQFGDAQREVHDFLWNEYCDWYLEFSKSTLNDKEKSDEEKRGTLYTLVHILETSLRGLHPFIPFITEE